MPVFTFEKLSPPARRVADASAAEKKQRGVISSILGRLTGARGKRRAKQRTVSARKKSKT